MKNIGKTIGALIMSLSIFSVAVPTYAQDKNAPKKPAAEKKVKKHKKAETSGKVSETAKEPKKK